MQATYWCPGSTTAGTAPCYGGSSGGSSSLRHIINNNNHINGSTARAIACKNNEALQHFLYGEFDTSIGLLKEAYGIFASFRHHYYLNLLQMQQMQHQIRSIYDVQGGSLLSIPSTSVAMMKEAGGDCNNRDSHNVEMEIDDGDDDLDRASSKNNTHRAEPPPQRPRSSSPSPSSCPSTSSMYNRAFVLATDEDDLTLLVTNERQTGAILLYNLGLVYHNIGYYLGVSAAVPHSIQLYQWSLSFLDLPSYRTTMDSSYQGVDCDHFKINSPSTAMHGGVPGTAVPQTAGGTGAGSRSTMAKTNERRYGDLQFQDQQQQSLPNHHTYHQEDPKLMLAVLNNLSNLFTYLHRIPETHYALYRLRVVLAASAMTHLTAVVSSMSASASALNPSITNESNNTNTTADTARSMITTGDDDYNWFFINALFQGKELNFAPAA
mmetsp:Transcript_3826/g.9178  ORF Transcript_3826/g.9178 Transcript_3826/m.9178 type:complete len:436 (+) Transcript_3826:573-1880(+)